MKSTLALDPKYPYAYLFLGNIQGATGRHAEAIAAYQQAMSLGLDTPSTRILLGAAYARTGDRARAQAILLQLRTGEAYVSPGELAMLYAALGERDQAFASLEQAYAMRDLQLQYLGVAEGFDPLRADPRFEDLLRRVGLSSAR